MFKVLKTLKERWKYNNRSNITNRTFIAHRVKNGVDQYAAAISSMDFRGRLRHEIYCMSFDEDYGEWIVCIGGLTMWTEDEESVKQALKNHTDLNLDLGRYSNKEVQVNYIKYPHDGSV